MDLISAILRRLERLETVEKSRWVYPYSPDWAGTAYIGMVSTSWDGDAYSTTAKTLIDLSAVFGVPAGAKAVKVKLEINDSGSAATDTWICLSPNDSANNGLFFSPMPVNDRKARYGGVCIPCNTDGDIYYQISASGSSTMDVVIQIWGYEL